MRARNNIKSKRKRVPTENLWLHLPKSEETVEIEYHRTMRGLPILSLPSDVFEKVFNKSRSMLIVSSRAHGMPPMNDRSIARFLAKIALEALAQHCIEIDWSLNTVIEDLRLDRIRDFARYDKKEHEWPYHVRKLYNENETFYYTKNINSPVDMLYQYGLMFVGEELYLITIIKGYEFAINFSGDSVGSYIRWLIINKGTSTLYKGNILYDGLF